MARTYRRRWSWQQDNNKNILETECRDAGCHRKCFCRAPKWRNGKDRLPARDKRRIDDDRCV